MENGTIKRVGYADSLLPQLALHLTQLERRDAIPLSSMVVMLPNRRSCQALQALMLPMADHQSCVLPRLLTLGDPDPLFMLEQAHRGGKTMLDAFLRLPTSHSAAFCQLALAQALRHAPRESQLHTFDHRLQAASDIWDTFDQLVRAGRSIDTICALNVSGISEHWWLRIQLLKYAADWWQRYANERHLCSIEEYRRNAAQWIGECWQLTPPEWPVIIAGSTGTHAATVQWMKTVRLLERGEVWLAGVEANGVIEEHEVVTPSHHQYFWMRLREELGIEFEQTEQVKGTAHASMQARATFLCHVLVPIPDPTSCPEPDEAIARIDCRNDREQAMVIAALMREGLEAGERHIALVTQNPALVRAVDALLEAQGLQASHGAGRYAIEHPQIQLWLLLAEAMLADYDPIAWLSLFKHDSCGIFTDVQAQRHWVERIERHYFRTLLPQHAFIRQLPEWAEMASDASPQDRRNIDECVARIQALYRLMHRHECPVSELLAAHDALFAHLVESADPVVAQWHETIAQASAAHVQIEPSDYLSLLRHLAKQSKWFPAEQAHPALAILSPIEARLLPFDRLILAGLNEGEWPAHDAVSGWLHPMIRPLLEMPPADASIGQSAHDFISLSCAASQVFWVRSHRSNGAQTLPSRWLERIGLCCPRYATDAKRHPVQQWLQEPWLLTDMSSNPPCANPPISSRPTRLSLSALEQLLRDPYGFYARYILELKALEPIGQTPDAALRGQLIHRILEYFAQAVDDDPSQLSVMGFIQIAEQVFAREISPLIVLQWRARLMSIADSVVVLEAERRKIFPDVQTEVTQEMSLSCEGIGWRIYGRMDRLEANDAFQSVIDYKTGESPAVKDIKSGFAPQLPVMALLAAANDASRPVAQIGYWEIRYGEDGVSPRYPVKDSELSELSNQYRDGISQLIARYHIDGAPYGAIPEPSMKPKYNDYEHLERLDQWMSD